MKSIFNASAILVIILYGLTFNFCKKKEIPILTTSEVTNITGTTAACGGTITDEGSGTVTVRGVCWSTNTTPTIEDNKTSDGAGAGSFVSNLTGLNGATNYFVRAYATNSAGTGYGNDMTFATQSLKAFLLTNHIWVSDSLLANGIDASSPGGLLGNFKGDTKFNEDGTAYFGVYTGTWRFASNETQIVMTANSLVLPLILNILELNTISLKMTTNVPNQLNPANPILIRMTYRAK